MTKLFFKSVIFSFVSLGMFFTSCQEDDFANDISASNYEDDLLSSANARGGGTSCFDLVFPVTIELSDGSQISVSDKEEFKAAAQEDLETNGREVGRPDLIFPVDVTIDGETQTITDQESFEEIISDCKGSNMRGKGRNGKRGKDGKGDKSKCFSVVYPVTYEFSDGSTLTVESREERRSAIQEFKEANPEINDKPSIQYPLTVNLEDGTTQSVSSEEELKALADSCDVDQDSN